MLTELQTGPINVSGSAKTIARAGQQGDQLVSELHGRYYEQAVRGNMFGITGGLTTTTAAGAATFTGLIVGNPASSGVNLAVNKCFVSQGAALTADTEIGIMYGINTTTASLATIFNRNAGGAASKAVANAGQTITAMTSFIVFAGSGSGAITVPGVIPVIGVDFEGGLIIPPGYAFASYTSRITTTALVFTFQWEEIPIL
jgi:hypothetical protein